MQNPGGLLRHGRREAGRQTEREVRVIYQESIPPHMTSRVSRDFTVS